VWERDDVLAQAASWYQAGVWRRLHQVLLEELAQADRIDWDRASPDSAAVPASAGVGRGCAGCQNQLQYQENSSTIIIRRCL
jgi:transposase